MTALAGRHALVTGGAGSLGRALAAVLLERGMTVTLADLDEKRLADADTQLGSPAALSRVVFDVAEPEAWTRALDETETAHGPVWLLCNNAGIPAQRAPLLSLAPDQWTRMMAVNLSSVYLGAWAAAPRMIAAGGGRILNTASIGGLLAQPGRGEYCAAKAGVISLSETLRAELEPHGVGVSVFCPGAIGHAVGYRWRPGDPPAATGRLDPRAGAETAIGAMLAGEFYLFTHRSDRDAVNRRCARLLAAFDRLADAPS